MFKHLLKALFPSVIPREYQPDYFYFERTRKEIEAAREESKDGVPAHSLTTQSPVQGDLSIHEQQFLGYLFGSAEVQDVPDSKNLDALSAYVLSRVDKLLDEPDQLFESLPVMPQSLTHLLSLLSGSAFDASTLVSIIEQEPSMAADLVKLANIINGSGVGNAEITDLKRAFVTVGTDGLLEGVIQIYVNRYIPPSGIYFKVFGQKIWEHSLQTARFSSDLAKAQSLDHSTAYFIGLLRNIGTMVIFQLLTEAFQQVDPNASPKTLAFKLLIKKYSIKLTYAMATHLELPMPISLALGVQKSKKLLENKFARIVFDANRLSEIKLLRQSRLIDEAEYARRVNKLLISEEGKRIAMN